MKNTLRVLGLGAIFALGVTSCSTGSASETGNETESKDSASQAAQFDPVDEIVDLVPSEVTERGTLNIGASSTNMPAQFTDEDGNLVGVAVEMYDAAAQVMGLEAEFDVVTFDALQPGVESGRYDFATMGVNEERLANFDIISLFSNGFSVVVPADFDGDITGFGSDLCGYSVAVTKGTLIEGRANEVADDCVANGQDEMTINSYVDNAGVILAITSKQNEVGVLENVVAAAYANRTESINAILGDPVASSGPGIDKENPELTEALRQALLHLVETGYYQEVMDAHGVGDMALPDMPLNDA